MKRVVLSMVGVAALVSVTSCNLFKGSGEKKAEEPAATTEQAPTTEPSAVATAAASSVADTSTLANAWQSSCTPAAVLQLSSSRRTVAMTSEGKFEKTEQFFAEGCDKPHALTYKTSGTYATMGQHPSNPSLQNIDFTVDVASISVASPATVEMMNSQGFCGITDWAVDHETEVTGKTCGSFTVQKGEVVMDVVEVKENNIYFGHQFSFMSAEDVKTRPEAVSVDAPYTKS